MSKTRQAKLDYIKAYNREHMVQLSVKLHTEHDADIIEHLGGIGESKAGYIKRLIREKIFKKNENSA